MTTMFNKTVFVVSTLFACTIVAHASSLTDERIFKEITRKLRSTGVSEYYNFGPATPKPKPSKEPIYDNICPTVTEWKNLSRAITVDGSEVEIMQGMFEWAYQWFYTVQCLPKVENRTCQWIDEKQAPRTVCRTSNNLVPAIVQVESNGQTTVDWRMIRIPGRCSCYRLRPAQNQSPTPYGTKLSALK